VWLGVRDSNHRAAGYRRRLRELAATLSDWSRVVARIYPKAALLWIRPSGGRTWWAHFEFTGINIRPTILRKKIEDSVSYARLVTNPTCR